MNQTILLILVGILGGILSGIFGIGGGIVLVPALVMLFDFSQKTAQGTTLLMLAIPLSLLPGIYNYYKAGFIDVKTALIIGFGFMGGTFLGSKAAMILPDSLSIAGYMIQQPMKKLFAILMIIMAYKLFTAQN